jgi:hypothetical protein
VTRRGKGQPVCESNVEQRAWEGVGREGGGEMPGAGRGTRLP